MKYFFKPIENIKELRFEKSLEGLYVQVQIFSLKSEDGIPQARKDYKT